MNAALLGFLTLVGGLTWLWDSPWPLIVTGALLFLAGLASAAP